MLLEYDIGLQKLAAHRYSSLWLEFTMFVMWAIPTLTIDGN